MPSPDVIARLKKHIADKKAGIVSAPKLTAHVRTDCVKRGAVIDTTKCQTCSGHVELKIFACETHGKCSLGKESSTGVKSCIGCGDQELPSHPNVNASFEYARHIPVYPEQRYSGRGIVIVGGGKYWASTYVTVRMLRRVGCMLPIYVYYLGEKECDDRYARILWQYGARVSDITAMPDAPQARSLTGFPGQPPFEAKSFAVLHSPLAEVLSLDADSYPCADPTPLFDCPDYKLTGGIYWPDLLNTNAWTRWNDWGVKPFGPECGWEVGQYVINKRTAWRQLNMARWYDDHGDWCYGYDRHHDHGDKGPHRVGWAMFRTEPTFYSHRAVWKSVAFVQPKRDGSPIFIHRCRSKFALAPVSFASTVQNGTNIRAGLPMEAEAFGYLAELQRLLTGA